MVLGIVLEFRSVFMRIMMAWFAVWQVNGNHFRSVTGFCYPSTGLSRALRA